MAGSPISIRETADGTVFRIRVVPRSSRSEIVGIQGDALKVRIAAPPVEGKANDECIRLIAELLGAKKADVKITSGHTSKTKTISVAGRTAAQIAALIPAHDSLLLKGF
jgi:uncharacterized protein (TIGR00251 family)